ncbi:MAG: hypothetical protein AAFV33_15670 [Chloroflexota bacterium]
MHPDDSANTPDLTPNSNGSKPPAQRLDNVRDILERLQHKLQTMGDESADETHPDAKATVPPAAETASPAAADPTEGEDEIATREDPAISGKAVRELSVKVDREARQALRRVQQHLVSAQMEMGAKHETVNLVEVVHHPQNPMADLNYVTPRRKTAWVSADQVKGGIDYLKSKNREPRVVFIEGLLPPLFARTLRELDLTVERETTLMVYLRDGFHGELPPETQVPKPPYNVRMETVTDVRGAEVWWYVWKNAYYDVLTLGVEPLYVGRNIGSIAMGNQIDIIAYRDTFPFAVARVTVHEETAHIANIAVFKEMRTPDVIHMLYENAVHVAMERGCDLVFAPGDDAVEREIVRKIGFIDFGSIVCYSAQSDSMPDYETNDAKPLVQPILNLR